MLDNNYSHNNTLLVVMSIFMNIFSRFTTENLSIIATIVAIIGGLLAIINYCLIFYSKWNKNKRKGNF